MIPDSRITSQDRSWLRSMHVSLEDSPAAARQQQQMNCDNCPALQARDLLLTNAWASYERVAQENSKLWREIRKLRRLRITAWLVAGAAVAVSLFMLVLR